jgi:hypothetical protein
VAGADTARSLITVGDAIEFDADFSGRNALNRKLDVEKAERGVVFRSFGIKIERADLAVSARTQLAIPRDLRVGPRWRPRRQWPQGTELPV